MLKPGNLSSRLFVSIFALTFALACSTGSKPQNDAHAWANTNSKANPEDQFERYSIEGHEYFHGRRSIAQASNGIGYPAERSFDLRDHTGKTYAHFMKTIVKPTLDSLSSEDNGGGGGFKNIGSSAFYKYKKELLPKTLSSYKGAKWNRTTRQYEGEMSDEDVALVYDTLKQIRPKSTTDSLGYYDRNDEEWFKKNDMAIAIKEAGVNSAPFDLATLYALTGGFGVKVKLDDQNYNYHVMYKTGKTNPSTEVMSGRSFASAPEHGVTDATDPEYLKDLKKYLTETEDHKPFYRAMMLALTNSDTSGWSEVSNEGQSVLSDFLTVYTAEADRHLMVNLQPGRHPWEIDLAAVTFVSAVSNKLGKVVVDGVLIVGDLGKWFAPSPNNQPGGPQRSGIGITRKDRKIFQKAIHKRVNQTTDGKKTIKSIQAIVGPSSDVIQSVFEYLSNKNTPKTMGANAKKLADLMATFADISVREASAIEALLPQPE